MSRRIKIEIALVFLAWLGLMSLPVAILTKNGDLFLYGYPLCFPFLFYHLRRKFKNG